MTKAFIDQLTFEYTQTLPEAPRGDRAEDLQVDVDVKLSCNGSVVDHWIQRTRQDLKDQLRQEYLDMEKKQIPERNQLISFMRTEHFVLEEFNHSERVSGEKYDYILFKILENLEDVSKRVNDTNMIINSGFRNPYKNNKTIGAGRESMHIYGLAADIARRDFNNDGKEDAKDWDIMAEAAKREGACIEPINKALTWIHMDWRGVCPSGW